jgi:hypothetical protein
MRRKLSARQRAAGLGAGLLGACLGVAGFASPALAAQSTGGTAASAQYNVYQGGAATTYLMEQQLANLFNASPGCDLASSSGTAQPLDYGCPGLNDPGTTLSHPQTTSVTGTVVKKSTTITLTTGTTTGFFTNDAVSDTGGAGVIPAGSVITSVPSSTTFVISKKPKTGATSDAILVTTTPAVGENGFTTFAQQNPFNDVLVEEPPIGASNGIQELEDQGAHGVGATSKGSPINVSPIDLASSARAPALTGTGGAGDDRGLNFVAYAMDGIDWIHWTSVSGTATPSAAVTNLTTAQLTSIYKNQSCTGPGSVNYPTPNWACYGGSVAPIAIYIANAGSGVESTWVTMLGLTGTFPYGGEDPNHVIFQNETSSILANHDQADAIYFFSYGRYQTECTPNPAFCTGASTSKIALGEINSVKPSTKTISAQLPGSTTVPFPGDELLYNVYSNGTNPDIPASSPAALNVASEDGFECKPSTNTDVDPNTGATYRSEITAAITAQGFVPLPLEVEDGQGATTGIFGTTGAGIPNPAWGDGLSGSAYNATNEATSPWNYPAGDQDDDNSAISGSYTGVYNDGTTGNATATPSAPVGYCLVLSTDGNSTN